MKLFQVQIPDKSTVSVIMGVSSLFPIWYMFHLVFSCLTVRRSTNVLVLLIGLILNEIVNYVLKHFIQAPRPDFPFSGASHGREENQMQENIFAVGVNVASHSSPPSSLSMGSMKRHDGFGMPSSHAQFMAFWLVFALLQGNFDAVRVVPSAYIEANSSRSGSTVDILDYVEDDADDDLEQNVKTPLQDLIQSHCIKLLDFVEMASVRVVSCADHRDQEQQTHVILNPHASKLKHVIFHPALYRNVQPLGCQDEGLDKLAAMLKVSRQQWNDRWLMVKNNQMVQFYLAQLRGGDSEANINNALQWLLGAIAGFLQVMPKPSAERKTRIGGIMARPEYDYQSCMDVCFQDYNCDSFTFFGTELKSRTAFPVYQHWYQDSRTAQMFAALYTLHAPIFLLNSERFKIFVENDARNELFTYPYTEEDGANASEPIDERLVKALIICLLRKPSERSKYQMSRIPKAVTINVPQTPLKQSQVMKSLRKRSLKAIPDSIDKVKPTKRTRRSNQEDDLDGLNGELDKDDHEDFQIGGLITPRFKCGEAEDGLFYIKR
ncbi:hypothetical protein MIR68_006350 [Amoeboaphelidium protococcarum]|nr:hypothetical protein MIR68_006350 [Amoeboaphelidium protococcarum]